MYTSRTLTGATLFEQLNPCFRMVDFSDSPAVVTVAHYLRLAWNTRNEGRYSSDEEGIGKFMRATQHRLALETLEEYEREEDDSDIDTIDEEDEGEGNLNEAEDIGHETKEESEHENEDEDKARVIQKADQEEKSDELNDWRLAILAFWNHVYWDVMQFLPQVGLGIGHFHPPSHSSLSIPFWPTPTSDPEPPARLMLLEELCQQPTKHTFGTNTLLIPAYLCPGVVLRMKVASQDGTTMETLGTFSDSSKTEIWWLRQGIEVSFYVDIRASTFTELKENVAAVLGIGVLCDDVHEVCCPLLQEIGEDMRKELS